MVSVYLSVVTNRAGAGQGQGRVGQGGQGRHPPTAGHFQLRLEKQQWWCLSVWQCLEDSSSHCPFPVEFPQM